MSLKSENHESSSWTWTREYTFPSDMKTAQCLVAEAVNAMRAAGWGHKDVFAVELALEETLSNAVKHGNESNPEKNVHFFCGLHSDALYARIEDEGEGFDPHALPDPRKPENQMTPSGRGVLLVRHFVTKVKWNRQGNMVEFEKDRTK